MGESVERLDKSPWVCHIGARKRGDGKGRRKGGMDGLKGCCFYNKPKQWILGTFRLARHVEDVVIFVLKWCNLLFFSFLVCHRIRGTFVCFAVAATHVEKVPKYPKVKMIMMYYIPCLNHIFVYHYKLNLQQNLYFSTIPRRRTRCAASRLVADPRELELGWNQNRMCLSLMGHISTGWWCETFFSILALTWGSWSNLAS